MSQLRNIMITKQSNLPYTRLPYCYFLNSPVATDILVDTTWTDFQLSVAPEQDCFVAGCRTSSSSTDKLEIRTNFSLARFNTILGGNSAAYSYVTDITTRSDIDIDGTDIKVTNSGSSSTVSVGTTPGFVACPYPLCIGGMQNGATVSSTLKMYGYFYGCKIYVSNVLAHDIFPVKDSNNIICLYDSITDKYYYPATGTNLYESKPTYTAIDHCYFDNSPVDLGFPLTNTITRFDISFTASSSNWICGARDYQTSSDRFTLQALNNTIVTNNISNTTAVTLTNLASLGNRIDYSYDGSTITVQNEGNTYTETDTRGFPSGLRNMIIGSMRNAGSITGSNQLVGYFWGNRIYDAGVLTHNIVAAKDTLNIICLYDTVTSTAYYPSSGTLAEEP